MRKEVKKYNIKRIWHFTDKSNLSMIVKHGGLLSLQQIREKDIRISAFGGNEWSHEADETKGIDRYVHLCFVDDHPMLFKARKEGRINNPVWLAVKSDVMFLEGVRFTTDISNKSGVDILSPEEAVEEIDFDILFTRTNWSDPEINKKRQRALKSEILVPNFLSIDFIEIY